MRLDDADGSVLKRLTGWLECPVDIAFLIVFRVAFGLLITLDVCWHFAYGFIRDYYIAPTFFFSYFGFGWVHPWPAAMMHAHFGLVGLSGLLIALGWHYRLATVMFFTGFAYLFLIDQSLYLNHNYLIVLIGFLLMFLPANRAFSLDVRHGRVPRAEITPAWTLWLMRFQIGIVYFFGGVAKINQDWLRGEPVRMWLDGRSGIPLIGPWLDTEFAVYFFSYGGLLFDLLIVPLLLWRPTRIIAVLMCAFFHLTNATLFDIGIFPWMMLASTFIFLPPDHLGRWFRRQSLRLTTATPWPPTRRSVFAVMAVFVALQLSLPLRHWLYPGDVTWTEEGHRFSWRMKLRSKQGWLNYRVVDPSSGQAVEVSPRTFATERQAARMATRPDMILQGAHWLADQGEKELGHKPRVFADAYCSLNGRAPRALIDKSIDLAAQPRTLRHASWITPFVDSPIRSPGQRRDVPTIVPWSQVLRRVPDTPDIQIEVMTRIIAQQAKNLDRVNLALREEFGLSPAGYYILSGRTIYSLTPKSNSVSDDLRIDVSDEASLRRAFDLRPLRVLESGEEMERYEALATKKAVLRARLEQLARMAPADSVQQVELD